MSDKRTVLIYVLHSLIALSRCTYAERKKWKAHFRIGGKRARETFRRTSAKGMIVATNGEEKRTTRDKERERERKRKKGGTGIRERRRNKERRERDKRRRVKC
ncbi:hypothetical protein PUN28_005839 [Cardiocondyla obscurior]|uniref:Secreted protein n=1 Tax=Cardiocondyla obscurior TaxID=286306 RepID=A0AAW2G802_9HYME